MDMENPPFASMIFLLIKLVLFNIRVTDHQMVQYMFFDDTLDAYIAKRCKHI